MEPCWKPCTTPPQPTTRPARKFAATYRALVAPGAFVCVYLKFRVWGESCSNRKPSILFQGQVARPTYVAGLYPWKSFNASRYLGLQAR